MAESFSSLDLDDSELMKKCRNDPHISSQFEILEKLGKGGYGTILKVRLKTDKKIYALKLIPVEKGEEKDQLLKEAEHLSSLQHKNIVRYYTSWIMGSTYDTEGEESFEEDKDIDNEKNDDDDSIVFEDTAPVSEGESEPRTTSFYSDDVEKDCSDSTDISASLSKLEISGGPSRPESALSTDDDVMTDEILCIKMEYCQTTLRNYITEKTSRTVDDIEKLLSSIVDGVMYIHQKGIMHRDIKPENIFLDEENCVKIGDFGLSCLHKSHESGSSSEHAESDPSILTRPVGTFLYMAPEICTEMDTGYGKNVDWYSVGIVLFELCYVFSTKSERCKVLDKLRKTSPIKLPDDFETHGVGVDHFKYKILTLLDHNPDNRLSAVQTRIQNQEIVWYEISGFCTICKIELPTLDAAKEHLTTKEHKVAETDWLKNHKGQGQMHHWCAVCQIPCNRIESLIAHAQGKQHDGKMKGNKEYYCDICEIYTTGSRNYNQHLASNNHQKAKELKEKGYTDKIFTCDICNINCSCQENLQEHCRGRSHRKRLNMSKSESECMFYCAQCHITCSGNESYNQHLNSRGHLKRTGEIQDSQEKKEYNCDVCNISCTGPESYKEHIESKHHAKEVMAKQGKSESFMCYDCNVNCTSSKNLEDHFKGQGHLKAVKSQNYANEKKNEYYCDVCEVSCTGPETFLQHNEGEKHKKKVSQLGAKNEQLLQTTLNPENGPADNDANYNCVVCEVSCNSPQSFKQHNESDKHIKKASKQDDKNEQTLFCDVCKVKCTSAENYKDHCAGKNHKKQLKRVDVLQKLDTSMSNSEDNDGTPT